jgi:hypothetical protein
VRSAAIVRRILIILGLSAGCGGLENDSTLRGAARLPSGCAGPAQRPPSVLDRSQTEEAGLDFPGSAATTGTIRFRFTHPLPIYPATYIWRYKPRSQSSYYTTFFWGNDGEFRWDRGRGNTYYGAHPYPMPAPNFVPIDKVGPRHWEISVNSIDVLSQPTVDYGRWHTQALRVWSGWAGKYHEFYWDLPDTTRVIRQKAPRSYGNTYPPRPALTFGDAPWNPSNEIMDGVLRGIQIYTASLTLSEILSESEVLLSTPAGAACVWYLNLNPTPDDIADKSGRGNNPEWVGPERPSPWDARLVR